MANYTRDLKARRSRRRFACAYQKRTTWHRLRSFSASITVRPVISVVVAVLLAGRSLVRSRAALHVEISASTAQHPPHCLSTRRVPVLPAARRDAAFAGVAATIAAMQIQDVMTAPRSPWQNPYVERLSDRYGVSVSIT